MAELKERDDLEPLEPLPAVFINAEQEFIGAATINFVVRIKPGATNVLEVPAGVGQDRAAIGIEGRWRWVEANVERADIGGVARTLDLYVTAAESDYDPGSPGEIDNTDRSFALALVEHNAAAPAGVDLTRKVAEAVWDGAKFTAVNAIIGGEVDTSTRPPAAHAASHRSGGTDELAHTALSARTVLRPGLANQVSAGRSLTVADFTTLLGLSQPAGLFNLAGLTNLGSGGALVNKGAVTFGKGITAAATEAAIFTGSTAQALYIADTGSEDPFRIRTGSWGCWFRTAKRGYSQAQTLICKAGLAGQRGWSLYIYNNVLGADHYYDGTNGVSANFGVTDVCDDRWHFVVVTHDAGVARVYLDGALEHSAAMPWPLFGSSAPLCVGANLAAPADPTSTSPHFGRIDEAFVTADVLSEEQVRLLYAAKVAHGFSVTPSRAHLNVRRRRQGAPLVAGDFPVSPLRLYNFTNGSPIGSPGTAPNIEGGATVVSGADGAQAGAFAFDGINDNLNTTDAGLPSGTATRSLGAWFCTSDSAGTIVSWGTNGALERLAVAGGLIAGTHTSGPAVNDGAWHHAVVVSDDTAAAGLKQRLYLDGRLVAVGASIASVTLNVFRVADDPATGSPFAGVVDGVFVCGYALTPEEILALYAKGSLAMPPSPKDAGAHVEAITSTDLYVVCDALEPQHQIDMVVA